MNWINPNVVLPWVDIDHDTGIVLKWPLHLYKWVKTTDPFLVHSVWEVHGYNDSFQGPYKDRWSCMSSAWDYHIEV